MSMLFGKFFSFPGIKLCQFLPIIIWVCTAKESQCLKIIIRLSIAGVESASRSPGGSVDMHTRLQS